MLPQLLVHNFFQLFALVSPATLHRFFSQVDSYPMSTSTAKHRRVMSKPTEDDDIGMQWTTTEDVRESVRTEIKAEARAKVVRRRNRRLIILAVIIMGLSALYWNRDSATDIATNFVHDQLPSGFLVENRGRPGLTYEKDFGKIEVKRPVVIIPGFFSSALEVWEMEPCLQSNITSSFRARMFGPNMLMELMRNPSCWMKHLRLGPNASDPNDDIRIRSADGPDASDYIVPGFWVWARILINLVDIEYEPRQIFVAPYDWRLSPLHAERRDGYFSNLKDRIEFLKRQNGQKVVVATHSYGALVFTEFLKWVERMEEVEYPEKEPSWQKDHVHAFFNMGGPLLGMPKALGASLSGEFRSTAMLPSVAKLMVNGHVPLKDRYTAFRSWPALHTMLPRIPCIWKDILTIRRDASDQPRTLSHKDTLKLLQERANHSGHQDLVDFIEENYAMLPTYPKYAKTLNVYCAHGSGYPTEIGFHYIWDDEVDGWRIDNDAPNSGVVEGSGDATIPVESLAYACRSKHFGWKKVANSSTVIEVWNHELNPDTAAPLDPRGGDYTGDHVDILGNKDVMTALLHVVSGKDHLVEGRTVSDIEDRVAEIDKNLGFTDDEKPELQRKKRDP